MDRVEHSEETRAAGARPDPRAGSLPREQEEAPGLDSAGDTKLFAVVLTAHYAKSVTDF